MSNIYDFKFNSMTQTNNDNCCVNQRNLQNTNNVNHILDNIFSSGSNFKDSLNMATSQPNVFIKGGNQLSMGGDNVDDSTKIMRGEDLNTEDKHKILLEERPYLTVPYMGKGKVDTTTESLLLQGEINSSRKTANYLSEKDYTKYQYPLIDPIASTMNNPATMIESDASKDWIRGGAPSRELLRKQNNQ